MFYVENNKFCSCIIIALFWVHTDSKCETIIKEKVKEFPLLEHNDRIF